MKIKKDMTYIVVKDFSDHNYNPEKVVFIKGKKYTAHQDNCIRGENDQSYDFTGYSKVDQYFEETTDNS